MREDVAQMEQAHAETIASMHDLSLFSPFNFFFFFSFVVFEKELYFWSAISPLSKWYLKVN